MMHGMKLKKKKAAAFGSYGWSGECVKEINERLAAAGLEVINDGLKMLWVPDESALAQCVEYGREIARQL